MIHYKTIEEVEIMAEGGKRLDAILDELVTLVRPGIRTIEIEQHALALIEKSGSQSTFLNFHGYPASTCISINDEVVHGIPGERVVKAGDVVGIDIGIRYNGFCTDMATTVAIDPIDNKTKQLLEVTQKAMEVGIAAALAGNHIGDISYAIQSYVDRYDYGIVQDLTGHGIGRDQWEEPSVPNFGKAGTGPLIKEGMVIAIEPMITLGTSMVNQLNDGWTIVTADGSKAAHFEHTIAITADGNRILTN